MPRSSTSLVLVVAALLMAPLAGAATGAPTDSGPSKQAIRALEIRGQALNQIYRLGNYAGPSKQAIRAMTLRGQALNRTYHLGQYAGPSKQAIRAMTLRGQALNRAYHLGHYRRPLEASDPRDDPPRPGPQPAPTTSATTPAGREAPSRGWLSRSQGRPSA